MSSKDEDESVTAPDESKKEEESRESPGLADPSPAAASPATAGASHSKAPSVYAAGRPPEGYYPPMYPPPPGDGSVPPYPPPRGYEGQPPPYGMPPHMAGYPPMYPYQPPMYPHYPGYPPPMYGYPPPDPNMGYQRPPGDEAHGHHHGYAKKSMDDESKTDDGHDGDEEGGEDIPGAVTARLKTYIKPRIPTTQDVLDRRARKNAQSRARAAKLRLRVIEIEKKRESERTEEEQAIFLQFENRRQRKNDRSRERAMEKKEEIDRILAKPEKKRTKIEKQFLDNALNAKKRKNEGDRSRRQRLKHMGVPAKLGLKGAIARGAHLRPMQPGYHPYPPPYGGPHMGEIPMSPMPPMGGHHPHMQSPGGFGSPGMMHAMGYPSPQRRGPGGPGAMETPGKSTGVGMPYMPPGQAYEGQGSPPGGRVEQRRNADGSMSISIGGGSGEGNDVSGQSENGQGEGAPYNLTELLLNDAHGEESGQNGEEESSSSK